MPNAKEVDIVLNITAERYYDRFFSEHEEFNGAMIAVEKELGFMVFNPVYGFKVTSEVDSNYRNFQIRVKGKEVVSWYHLENLLIKMRRVGFVVAQAREINDDSDSDWTEL